MKRSFQNAFRLLPRYEGKQNWMIRQIISISRSSKNTESFATIKESANILTLKKTQNKRRNNFTIITPATKFFLSQANRGKTSAHPNPARYNIGCGNNNLPAKILSEIEMMTNSDEYDFDNRRGLKRGRDTYKDQRRHNSPNIRRLSLIMAAQLNGSFSLYRPFLS